MKVLYLRNFIFTNNFNGGSTSVETVNPTVRAIIDSFRGSQDMLLGSGLFLESDNQHIVINHGRPDLEERVSLTDDQVLRKYLESFVIYRISEKQNNNDSDFLRQHTQRFLEADRARLVVHDNRLLINSNSIGLTDMNDYLTIAIKFYFIS